MGHSLTQTIGQTLGGLALLLLGIGNVLAGQFQVNPVRVDLSARQPVESLMVSNISDEPVVIQLETVHWAQADSGDVFSPTETILATPPVFQIPARESQIVRVGLRNNNDSGQEQSYRIFLQEVLPEPSSGFQGMRVALRISIPVFIQPEQPVKAHPEWTVKRVPPTEIQLRLANTGDAHLKVTDIQLSLANHQQPFTRQVSQYVLPGQQHTWTIDTDLLPDAGTTANIQALINTRETRHRVSIEE